MQLNHHMASVANSGRASELHGQEAKRTMLEAEKIEYGARLEGGLRGEMKVVDGWRVASDTLKEYIMRECEMWGEVIEKREGRERLKAEIMEEMRIQGRRERGEYGARAERPRGRATDTGCYTCGEKGHVAGDCPKRINKTTFRKRSGRERRP